MTNYATIQSTFDEIVNDFGRIDGLLVIIILNTSILVMRYFSYANDPYTALKGNCRWHLP